MTEKKKIRWGAVFTEEDPTRDQAYKLSMGRVMGWLMFVLLMVLWSINGVVPDSLLVIFLSIMGYNLGGKITPAINAVIARGMGSKKSDDPS